VNEWVPQRGKITEPAGGRLGSEKMRIPGGNVKRKARNTKGQGCGGEAYTAARPGGPNASRKKVTTSCGENVKLIATQFGGVLREKEKRKSRAGQNYGQVGVLTTKGTIARGQWPEERKDFWEEKVWAETHQRRVGYQRGKGEGHEREVALLGGTTCHWEKKKLRARKTGKAQITLTEVRGRVPK